MNFLKKMNDIVGPWEAALLLMIAYTLLDIPLEAAFSAPPNTFEIAMDFIISAGFFLDAVIFYRKGSKSNIHLSWTWDVARIASALPLMSMTALLINPTASWPIYIQIFRVARLKSIVASLIERSKHHLVPKRLKFIAAAAVTLIVFNFLACAWLVINPPGSDPLTDYNKAMYWVITTIATVGYGDITPSSNIGRLYAMGVMILGATIWGILIASASRMMLASDHRKERKKEKLEALHSFFSHYEVPKNLQSEVTSFFHHLWARKMSDDERAILNDLPPALQAELQTYMNLKPISRVALFKDVSFNCLAAASKRLEQKFFSPGEKIITKGEIGADMFLIGHGTVTVHIGDQFITNLGDGTCFGEMALISDGFRTTDVTASTYCDIFTLSKEKFEELIHDHEDLRKNVVKLATDRRALSNQPNDADSTTKKAS